MLGIILKILAILGWFLLFVVILLLVLLLLAAVYPISYRLWWEKNADNMLVKAKASWLLGLLRVCFEYPEPGSVIVKLLGFTVFDSVKSPKEQDEKKAVSAPKAKTDDNSKYAGRTPKTQDTSDVDSDPQSTINQTDAGTETTDDDSAPGIITRIRNIIENITAKIRQICDKIKNISELAEYYLKLLKEEDTVKLFSRIFTGSGNILKSIRPRKIKGHILLGTGLPDTTGYAMAVYGILSPYLGQNLLLTPDFEEKVLEGRLYIKGRIIIGVLLVNGLKVALDRRLRSFIKKIKREVI